MRRFTKRRNCSTLRGHQSDNLSFKEDGMTRRSMPSSFHANLFALVPARCPSSTCDVAMVRHLGTFLFCRQFGTLLAQALHRGCSGKCGPVFGRIPGRGFRMGWVAESATRNDALKRDGVSPTRFKRKAHPIPELQNGMHFPRGRIDAVALGSAVVTRPESALRALLGCPPRSRRRLLRALRGRGSPS